MSASSYRNLPLACCVFTICSVIQFSFQSATETSECQGRVADSQWQRVPNHGRSISGICSGSGYFSLDIFPHAHVPSLTIFPPFVHGVGHFPLPPSPYADLQCEAAIYR